MHIYFINEYLILVIVGSLLFVLSSIICFFPVILNSYSKTPEKLSAYECGFNPFNNARQEFTIQFYMAALLFIVFDAEITLLYPLALGWPIINLFSFYFLVIFFFLLLAGLIYEMYQTALQW